MTKSSKANWTCLYVKIRLFLPVEGGGRRRVGEDDQEQTFNPTRFLEGLVESFYGVNFLFSLIYQFLKIIKDKKYYFWDFSIDQIYLLNHRRHLIIVNPKLVSFSRISKRFREVILEVFFFNLPILEHSRRQERLFW